MKNIIKLLAVFLAVAGVHYFVFWEYSDELFFRIYGFLFLILIIVFYLLNISFKHFKEYLGYIFLGIIFVKLPLVKFYFDSLSMENLPNYKIHFIAPYLVSVFLIVSLSITFLNKK
ncbi:MAG: hypothetical protein H6604_06595 [Flavobacteriales bacterium]|nr:hypothetical protein [Flavobacteriales bacterium]